MMRMRVNALPCGAVCIELRCAQRTLHSINGSMDCFLPPPPTPVRSCGGTLSVASKLEKQQLSTSCCRFISLVI